MKQELGRKIVMLRRERGLSQTDFARAISLSRVTLSHYERGQREIRTEALLKIAGHFDVSVEYLIGNTECRLSTRSYHDVFIEKDGQRIKNGVCYEMLNGIPLDNREAVYNMLVAMMKK